MSVAMPAHIPNPAKPEKKVANRHWAGCVATADKVGKVSPPSGNVLSVRNRDFLLRPEAEKSVLE